MAELYRFTTTNYSISVIFNFLNEVFHAFKKYFYIIKTHLLQYYFFYVSTCSVQNLFFLFAFAFYRISFIIFYFIIFFIFIRSLLISDYSNFGPLGF